jgi:hypothetical protein
MSDNPDGYLTWDRLVTEVNFLEILRQEAKRTVLCHADDAARIVAAIEERDVADILTVRVSPVCDPGRIYVLDESAMAAAEAEFMQGLARRPWRFGGLT